MICPPRALAAGAVTAMASLVLTACGNSTHMSGAHHGATPHMTASGHPGGTHGMGVAGGDGLTAAADGLTLSLAAATLPGGRAASLLFRITGTGGKPVTTFESDQTKLMHLYLIRSDLTGFQHVHPTMSADGNWTAPLASTRPGTYRAYTAFRATTAGKSVPLVLSRQLTVPGAATTTPIPPPSTTTETDGYTLTLRADRMMAAVAHTLTVTFSRNGRPVTDLQPYLDTYAHLTAIHDRDLAFAHLHPLGDMANSERGGPRLSFAANLPRSGNWRLYLQFRTAGVLRTAAVTLSVG